MAWCEACDRFLTPTSLGTAGECPRCGGEVCGDVDDLKVPWHFKLLVVATVLYLGWRAVQGVAWVVSRL